MTGEWAAQHAKRHDKMQEFLQGVRTARAAGDTQTADRYSRAAMKVLHVPFAEIENLVTKEI